MTAAIASLVLLSVRAPLEASAGAPREVRLRASCGCHRKLRPDFPAR